MSYVITEKCLGERYVTCVAVCPVDCIKPAVPCSCRSLGRLDREASPNCGSAPRTSRRTEESTAVFISLCSIKRRELYSLGQAYSRTTVMRCPSLSTSIIEHRSGSGGALERLSKRIKVPESRPSRSR